jgi:polyisoprenoid-binding protein YceI
MRPHLRTSLAAVVLAALVVPGAHAQATFRVDAARSTVVYEMRHPAHSFSGTSRQVSGTITTDAAGVVTAATVSAPVASFSSGNRNRDSNMIEATEGYLYRTVSFQLTGLAMLEAPTAEANATAEGTLTFHGVRQNVRLPVLVQRSGSGDEVRVRGAFDVTLTQFRIAPPRLLGVPVRDEIHLILDLTARRS